MDSPDDTVDSGSCTPATAVFFDLGDTLVVQRAEDDLFELTEPASQLLDAIGDLPIGIITNVPARWEREDLAALLADPTLLDRFDLVLLSSQASAGPKPDPGIYEEAAELLGVPTTESIFVTEELDGIADAEPPTSGARAAGMVGIWVSAEAANPLANHTVAPEELPAITRWLSCLEAE